MDEIYTHIKVCKTFQKNNKQKLNYEKLPAKEAESIPWDKLLVYLIDPYKIRREGCDKPLILKALTMIDPKTGWLETVQYNDKKATTIANLVEKTWLYRYPGTTIITYNRGNEFPGHAFKNDIIKIKYGIKSKCETTAKP